MNLLSCDTYCVKILFLLLFLYVLVVLISSHYCNNENNISNIEKFRNIDIYSNNIFLLILTSPVIGAPIPLLTNWVTGDLHGIQCVSIFVFPSV